MRDGVRNRPIQKARVFQRNQVSGFGPISLVEPRGHRRHPLRVAITDGRGLRLLVDSVNRIGFSICMKFLLLSPILLFAASAFAADGPTLPSIPAEPIVKKIELLFSDDFERAGLGKPAPLNDLP
jgi:hypothetical protein